MIKKNNTKTNQKLKHKPNQKLKHNSSKTNQKPTRTNQTQLILFFWVPMNKFTWCPPWGHHTTSFLVFHVRWAPPTNALYQQHRFSCWEFSLLSCAVSTTPFICESPLPIWVLSLRGVASWFLTLSCWMYFLSQTVQPVIVILMWKFRAQYQLGPMNFKKVKIARNTATYV